MTQCQEVRHNWDSLHAGPSWCQHYDTESAGSGIGVLDGGSLCRMYIFKNRNVACLCRLKFPLSPVEFKKWPGPMSYLFGPRAAVIKVHVTLSNLTNSHVTLSIFWGLGPWNWGSVSSAGESGFFTTHLQRCQTSRSLMRFPQFY